MMALVMALAAPAQSAEIPPTPACEAAGKDLFARYAKEVLANPAKKPVRRADRRFAERLAAAGCISDAEPLVRRIRAKPFTPQCFEAAARAEAFVGPNTATLNKLTRKFIRQVKKPFDERERALKQRKTRLKAQDKARLVAMIDRKLERLRDAYRARDRAYGRRIMPLYADNSYAFYLTLAELRSLLCVGFESPFAAAGGPGQRFASKNRELLFTSIFFMWVEAWSEEDSSAAPSSVELSSGMGKGAGGGLPLFSAG
jgi:hypothetical protein